MTERPLTLYFAEDVAAKVVEAVAAERERIAKLAKAVGARYYPQPGCPASFADLIRQEAS